jgi:hypothetical protein
MSGEGREPVSSDARRNPMTETTSGSGVPDRIALVP